MAAGKIQAPQPSIFQDSALEQIYARGSLDRDMSGLSLMLMNAVGGRSAGNQERYLGGLDQANQRAMALQQLEEAFKFRTAQMENSRHLALGGYKPSTTSGYSMLFPTGSENPDAVAQLIQDKIAADIFQKRQAGAASGVAKAPQFTEETVVMPGTAESVTKLTGKGPNLTGVSSTVQARAAQIKEAIKNRPDLTPAQKQAALNALARQTQPGAE